jgi:hypothetical protein
MTDLNTSRVTPFCRKVDEWPIWSEKYLSKAKRNGYKDVLSIPMAEEEFAEVSDLGKMMTSSIKLNKIAYTKRNLSIDVKASKGKITLNTVKGCKNKS